MPSSSLQTSSSAHADTNAQSFKRRQIRKGTFSCWECKRRKTRCELRRSPSSISICVSCQRRGTPCVPQDFSDPADSSDVGVEQRVVQVETLVSQLLQERSYASTREDGFDMLEGNTGNGYCLDESPVQLIELSAEDDVGWTVPSLLTTARKLYPENRSLSSHLYAILPHPTKAALIMSHGKFSNLPIHVRGLSPKDITSPVSNTQSIVQPSKVPLPTAHPVQFARKLIEFALCLHQLKKPNYEAARRYVDIAALYVTSQDALMESIEGVETLMLESCYHINVGNTRRAWLVVRRALAIAQLIGLPQQIGHADSREENIWFRLLLGDRSLSWMLGLPLAISENLFANEYELGADAWSARLERTHTTVFGRIITRNVRMQRRQCKPRPGETGSYNDHRETQEIDHQLKHAAESLPVDWWFCPGRKDGPMHVDTMGKTEKLIAQMQHQFLLIILHQPYLLRKPRLDARNGNVDCVPSLFGDEYSQVAIHSASREMLSRFLVLRNFHRTLSYRGADDKAFIAAAMFMLVHIDGRNHMNPNVLEHQRPHDVGIINEVISIMEETSSTNKDELSKSMVQVLRRLRDIEARSARGRCYSVRIEEVPVVTDSYNLSDDVNVSSLPMPYFGSIRIACETPADVRSPTTSRLDWSYLEEFTRETYADTGFNDISSTSLISGTPNTALATSLQHLDAVPSNEVAGNDKNVDLHLMDPEMQYLCQSPRRLLKETTQLYESARQFNGMDQEVDTSFWEPWSNGEMLIEEPS